MSAHPLCRECDGAGWIPYYSETVDGELEEAYRLCPNCYAPRYCMGKADQPCLRPGTVRYGLGYYYKEHIGMVDRLGEDLDHAYEAIHYLRRWLRVAHDRADEFLEIQLLQALGKAQMKLRRAKRKRNQACEDSGIPD